MVIRMEPLSELAERLGADAAEAKPTVFPSLRRFELYSGTGRHSVQWIDGDGDLASQSGFWNGRFVAELFKYVRVAASVGNFRFFWRKSLSDQREFVATAVRWHFGDHRRVGDLSLAEVFELADQLALIQTAIADRVPNSSIGVVNQNRNQIAAFLFDRFHFAVDFFFRKHPNLFENPKAAEQRIQSLEATVADFGVYSFDSALPITLCHGNLNVESLRFDGKQFGIADWEFGHFGVLGSDICSLLATSVSAATRRQWVRNVLRRYYYALVDGGFAPPVGLAQLSSLYLRSLRRFSLNGLVRLLGLFELRELNDEQMKIECRRLEELLVDADQIQKRPIADETDDLRIQLE